MPKYSYIAKLNPHKNIEAEIEAESEQDAVNKLVKEGLFPISVRLKGLPAGKQEHWYARRVSRRELVTFSRQLASLNASGVNILNSLQIISTQTPNKYLKTVLADITSKIKDGKSLSLSMSLYPDLFSNLYTSMIHSGEVGGTLDESISRLADFLEEEEEFRNSLRAALTYPFFILSVGILTIAVLLTFVIPRLVTMFEDMGQALPLVTRMLIGLSGFLRSYWWFILAIIVIIGFLWRRLQHNPKGRFFWDTLKLKFKVYGPIVLKTEIGRLMRTMSLLFSGGVPIMHTLAVGVSVLENEALKLEVQKFKERIRGGASFSQCLTDSKLFPLYVTNIIRVGEETGTLEKSLLRIANDYEKEVKRSLGVFSRLLEPVIILVMGLIVGFIVLSMLLPIFQINLIVR